MQTKPILDLSAAVARQSDVKPTQARPIELDVAILQGVAGGGAPRGGWSTETLVVETDAPRGGW